MMNKNHIQNLQENHAQNAETAAFRTLEACKYGVKEATILQTLRNYAESGTEQHYFVELPVTIDNLSVLMPYFSDSEAKLTLLKLNDASAITILSKTSLSIPKHSRKMLIDNEAEFNRVKDIAWDIAITPAKTKLALMTLIFNADANLELTEEMTQKARVQTGMSIRSFQKAAGKLVELDFIEHMPNGSVRICLEGKAL